MKRYFGLLTALFLLGVSVTLAQPIVKDMPNSVLQSSITSVNGSIPSSSTTVTLSGASSRITIWTSSDAANLYVNFNGSAATSSNAIIYPNSSLTITTMPIKSFKILGASAAGTYNLVAY